MRTWVIALGVVAHVGVAAADEPGDIELHGFVSEGAFVSTSNDYIGHSSRGSLAMFEAALNVSKQIDDRLRIGVQVFGRDVGLYRETPHFDWAYADYRWQPWLGLRAGIIKMPFGLYNETLDVDASHLPILMPQGMYSVRTRDILLSHTGFAAYGNRPIGGAGELDYQAWLGTLDITESSLGSFPGGSIDEIDTKYVTGAQLFWSPPVDGLRIGGTFLRTSITFDLTLGPELVDQLAMGGAVPPDFDGKLRLAVRPVTMVVGSAEYLHEDWQLAAEYRRSYNRNVSNVPELVPETHSEAETFYGMVGYRFSEKIAAGGYYSMTHPDAHDRDGSDKTRFPKKRLAFQRDAAATLEYDVNDLWSWKAEAHFIDGVGDLGSSSDPDPERFWGLFLIKTTVTF